jgi:hypothetical protein
VATDLEKALKKARYTALPLPRGKTGPTTIIAFRSGQLYVVRNAAACLKLEVTQDPSIDTIQFTKKFSFGLSGVVDFLARLLGIGNAKGELNVRSVTSATVQMGGLSHDTIQTGALVDFVASLQDSGCRRDLLAADHLTIVAALRAESFRFTFQSERGTTVKLSAEEATGLFKADANVGVEVSESGEIVVKSPSYVGVVAWDGRTLAREVERARRSNEALRALSPPDLWARATTPEQILSRRLTSLGIRSGPSLNGGKRSRTTTRRRTRTVVSRSR